MCVVSQIIECCPVKTASVQNRTSVLRIINLILYQLCHSYSCTSTQILQRMIYEKIICLCSHFQFCIYVESKFG
jgi:hypothetical protein